jgi:nucleoside-diphosphate-sugar epimerase
MQKVFVTGGAGFIGRHLIQALVEQGHEVTCLMRSTSRLKLLEGLPIQIAKGDVTDIDSLRAALAGYDVVYHLAGLTKALSLRKLLDVNAAGTHNVIQTAAARTNPPVVILVSSLAVAGPSPANQPREPHETPCPVSNYGASKLAGEIAAASLASQVPITIVRPPIVFGEADMLSLELFQPVVTFGVHTVPGMAARNYSLVHAGDLSQLLLLAAERGRRLKASDRPLDWRRWSEADGNRQSMLIDAGFPAANGQGIYYAADDEQPTFAELGRLIATAAGRRRCLVLHTPDAVVRGLGLAGEGLGKLLGKPMSLNRDKAREATAGHWTCSTATAKAELGFAPAAPLIERLRQTVAWYREQGWI